MHVRRAGLDDILTLTALRSAMWSEMHPEAPADDALREATETWLRDELPADRARAFIAFDSDRSVGMALLLVHEHPPRIRGRERRGYVTAVFVDEALG